MGQCSSFFSLHGRVPSFHHRRRTTGSFGSAWGTTLSGAPGHSSERQRCIFWLSGVLIRSSSVGRFPRVWSAEGVTGSPSHAVTNVTCASVSMSGWASSSQGNGLVSAGRGAAAVPSGRTIVVRGKLATNMMAVVGKMCIGCAGLLYWGGLNGRFFSREEALSSKRRINSPARLLANGSRDGVDGHLQCVEQD